MTQLNISATVEVDADNMLEVSETHAIPLLQLVWAYAYIGEKPFNVLLLEDVDEDMEHFLLAYGDRP